MTVFGIRTYFLEEGRIAKVGSDTFCSRVFPGLAGSSAVRVEVVFNRRRVYIVRILMDYIYFNEDGRINYRPQDLRLAGALEQGLAELGLKEERKSKTAFFRYRLRRVILTDLQKRLLKDRINRDFGDCTWENLPGQMREQLWAKNWGAL